MSAMLFDCIEVLALVAVQNAAPIRICTYRHQQFSQNNVALAPAGMHR